MNFNATSKPREAKIEAVVIRANGTRQNLGTIAYYHRNPLRRLAWRVRQAVRKLYRKEGN